MCGLVSCTIALSFAVCSADAIVVVAPGQRFVYNGDNSGLLGGSGGSRFTAVLRRRERVERSREGDAMRRDAIAMRRAAGQGKGDRLTMMQEEADRQVVERSGLAGDGWAVVAKSRPAEVNGEAGFWGTGSAAQPPPPCRLGVATGRR